MKGPINLNTTLDGSIRVVYTLTSKYKGPYISGHSGSLLDRLDQHKSTTPLTGEILLLRFWTLMSTENAPSLSDHEVYQVLNTR